MSDVPPTRPFLVCECGFQAELLAGLRRHQYGIQDGLVGHHTQLPWRRPRDATADSHASDQEDGTEEDGGAGAAGRGLAGAAARGRAARPGRGRTRAAARACAADGRGAGATDGNDADDESDAPLSPTPSAPASSESGSTAHSAVESQLRTLLELTRVLVPPVDGGAAAADEVPEYLYSSVGVHVRALYEALGDARRAQPRVQRRKRAKLGRFNTVRLRALQCFFLQVGGAGLSEKEQEFLYDFLDVWDGTKAGMAEDAGHHKTLRYSFPSVKAFKNALRDDLDDAALNAGWKKVKLVEGGVPYEAYFRDVLQVVRDLIQKKGGNIQLWSGVARPTPPNDRRESPMDGSAFKMCEEMVMNNREELACVFGLHVFSDSSQVSWSGGTFLFAVGLSRSTLSIASRDRRLGPGTNWTHYFIFFFIFLFLPVGRLAQHTNCTQCVYAS